jgi:hypothetical protein
MSTIIIDGRLFLERKAAIEFLELNENSVLICDNAKEKADLQGKHPKMASRFVLWDEVKKGEVKKE